MSLKDLAKNVHEVHGEAMAMLENLEKVKGVKYALTVQSMLVASQAGVLFGMICSAIEDEKAKVLTHAFNSLMVQMVSNAARLGELDHDEVQTACNDADSISDGVDGLLRNAIKAAKHDAPFGSR